MGEAESLKCCSRNSQKHLHTDCGVLRCRWNSLQHPLASFRNVCEEFFGRFYNSGRICQEMVSYSYCKPSMQGPERTKVTPSLLGIKSFGMDQKENCPLLLAPQCK